jgi:hypothetical protein
MSLFGCSRGLATALRRVPIPASRQCMPAKRRSDDDAVIPRRAPTAASQQSASRCESRIMALPEAGCNRSVRIHLDRAARASRRGACVDTRRTPRAVSRHPPVAAGARGGLGPGRARPVPICAHRLHSRRRLVGSSFTAGPWSCSSIRVPLKTRHRPTCVRSRAVPSFTAVSSPKRAYLMQSAECRGVDQGGGARTVVPSERSIAIPVAGEHPRSAPVA